LWVIREELGLTGTKFGCGIGACGACTVLIEGKATRTCITSLDDVAGQEITTIEGLSAGVSHPVQRAWIAEEVSQCGYCQSGMILATVSLLEELKKSGETLTEERLTSSVTNLCRCGTYHRVKAAALRAAGEMTRG